MTDDDEKVPTSHELEAMIRARHAASGRHDHIDETASRRDLIEDSYAHTFGALIICLHHVDDYMYVRVHDHGAVSTFSECNGDKRYDSVEEFLADFCD